MWQEKLSYSSGCLRGFHMCHCRKIHFWCFQYWFVNTDFFSLHRCVANSFSRTAYTQTTCLLTTVILCGIDVPAVCGKINMLLIL